MTSAPEKFILSSCSLSAAKLQLRATTRAAVFALIRDPCAPRAAGWGLAGRFAGRHPGPPRPRDGLSKRTPGGPSWAGLLTELGATEKFRLPVWNLIAYRYLVLTEKGRRRRG